MFGLQINNEFYLMPLFPKQGFVQYIIFKAVSYNIVFDSMKWRLKTISQ